MDLYFPDDRGSGKFRREVLRMDAPDDAAAMAEANRIDLWKGTSFYEVRAITKSVRTGDKLIFSSRPPEPAPGEPEAAESQAPAAESLA